MKKELNMQDLNKVAGGTSVVVKENESLESALRRFKKTCAKEGTERELRKREHYEKPSVKRKKKAAAAIKIRY